MSEPIKVKTMMLFRNGNYAAFDESGMQIPHLQMPDAAELWAIYATDAGYDVEGCEVRIDNMRAVLEDTPRGWVSRLVETPPNP